MISPELIILAALIAVVVVPILAYEHKRNTK